MKNQKYIVCLQYTNIFYDYTKPILLYADIQTAKSICRHYNKIFTYHQRKTGCYDDMGFYCMNISRKYCTNFQDFAKYTFTPGIECELDYLLNVEIPQMEGKFYEE